MFNVVASPFSNSMYPLAGRLTTKKLQNIFFIHLDHIVIYNHKHFH